MANYDSAKYAPFVADFVDFLNNSPTPYHAVRSSRAMLESAGFVGIAETEDWTKKIGNGGKYYLTRNGSAIVAFAVGGQWEPSKPISIVAAHSDSPCFHIKPRSRRPNSENYLQFGVSPYGGGQWQSWFDRDLGLAGRVVYRAEDGSPAVKLVHIKKTLLSIPTLAIHLHRQEAFAFNKEEQLLPILGLIDAELNKSDKKANAEVEKDAVQNLDKLSIQNAEKDGFHSLDKLSTRHGPRLLAEIAKEAGLEVHQIIDFHLSLYDVQPATVGGLDDKFVYSARLDNLMMSYCAIRGLVESLKDDSVLKDDPTIRMAVLFDNEEIGSRTRQGADSDFLPNVFRRLSEIHPRHGPVPDPASTFARTCSSSFVLSADMAHAFHPNYAGKYEGQHRPHINGGPVIKVNANARYATTDLTRVALEQVATEAGVPLQEFVVRNDSLCGSTIGPFLSSLLSVPTLDLGNPQLAMHSIREVGGTEDVCHAVRLFEVFFNRYGKAKVYKVLGLADELGASERL